MKICLICEKLLTRRQKVFCSVACQGLSRKHSIKTCKEFAKSLEGECLSTEYSRNSTYMKWRCANGHEWEIPFANVLAGNWCSECIRIKWTTQKMHSYIEKLGGRCSDEYLSMKARISVACPCGHNFSTNLNNIVQRAEKTNRFPCLKCRPLIVAEKVQKWTKEQAKLIIEQNNGQLLSEFNAVHKPIEIMCQQGHLWQTDLDRVNQGHWCPFCAHNRPINLNDVKQLGEQRGLVLLSKIYVRSSDRLKWKCNDDHFFEACWNSIHNGSGCPYCYGGIKEAKCRFILEESFQAKFQQTRKQIGDNYQLDGYNEGLKIAFEYQGEQHYRPAYYHKNHPERFRKLQEIDQIKRDRCSEQEIACIEIPYWESETDERLKKFIHDECNRLGLQPPTAPILVKMDDFKGRPSKLKPVLDIIELDGGVLLAGQYEGYSRSTLQIQCKNGHVAITSPASIFRSQNDERRGWCKKCGYMNISKLRKAYWQRLREAAACQFIQRRR